MSRVALALKDITAIRDLVQSDNPDDTDLLEDMMEAETDLHALCSWAFKKMETEDGYVESLNEQISNRQTRRTRAKKRKDAMRELVLHLLNAADLDKLEIPEATFSRRKVAPKRVVVDKDALPHEYVTYTIKPNMAAIKEAETLPDGVTMDNGGQSLTVRTK